MYQQKLVEIKMKITIYLVEHGYQIDVEGSDRKSIYDDDVLSECRDYGNNIDIEQGLDDILNVVRKLDK